MGTNNNNNGSFVPAIIYNNVDINKSEILSDNKGKTGIYMWTHKESNKTYIGSAADLSKRLRKYYSKTFINKVKGNSYIYNALAHHTHSAFFFQFLNILIFLIYLKKKHVN